MQKLTKLLIKNKEEIVNYIIVGGLTTLISLISYYLFSTILLNDTAINMEISNVLSWIISVSFAYAANRKYVFKSKTLGKKKHFEIINFLSSRIFSLLIEMILMYLMVILLSINNMVSKVIVQVIVIVLNFILSKLIVFKKTIKNY
ncbi:MAG: GtrA family protein [Bacilli bacterium]